MRVDKLGKIMGAHQPAGKFKKNPRRKRTTRARKRRNGTKLKKKDPPLPKWVRLKPKRDSREEDIKTRPRKVFEKY